MDLFPEQPLALPYTWKQGEHMAIIGDTGTGKSTLAARLILSRNYTCAFQTKSDKVKWPGKLLKRPADFKTPPPRWFSKPNRDRRAQRAFIADVFERAWNQHGWTLVVDELFYFQTKLELGDDVDTMLTQGRSIGITMVTGMQRPVSITRFAISQATHVLVFRQDGRDVKTVVDATSVALKEPLNQLGKFEFLWYYRPDRVFWIGKLDVKNNVLVTSKGRE